MKPIKDFINDNLKEDLFYNLREINEAGGLYIGQIELASFLTDEFEKEIKNSKNKEIKKEYFFNELSFKNIFFDKLSIIYHIETYRKDIRGESNFLYYDNTEKDDKFLKFNFNIKTKRLKLISIDIYLSDVFTNETYDKLRGKIVHEFNHAHTYYDIIIDDLKEDNGNIIVPDEYNSILHKWKDESYIKIIKDIDNKNEIAKRWSSLLIYSLTRYERNAFLAEIDSYLFSKHGDKLKSVESIENELSKCNQYNIYKNETFEVLDIIKNQWNDEQKKVLSDLYNKVYNTDKSFKKIMYILKSKNKYTINKLDKNIKTLTLEYKDIKENTQVPFEGSLSFFNNPMDKYIEWF